jgi:hypothetical protein
MLAQFVAQVLGCLRMMNSRSPICVPTPASAETV